MKRNAAMRQEGPNGGFRLRHQGLIMNGVDARTAHRLPVLHQSLILPVIVTQPIQSVGPGECGLEPLKIAAQHRVHGISDTMDDPGVWHQQRDPADVLEVLGHFVCDPLFALSILFSTIQVPLPQFVHQGRVQLSGAFWKRGVAMGFCQQAGGADIFKLACSVNIRMRGQYLFDQTGS